MAKRAVLVGCNYPGTKAELHGCVNDVKRMHQGLVEKFGFSEEDITVLLDTDPETPKPTGANVRKALANLVHGAQPGDVLFFHYSGHGVRVPAESGEQDDSGYDECIVPCDMNLITDEDFRDLVAKVPRGCTFTIVSDSCHSGGLIENQKEQIGHSTKNGGAEGREEEGSLTNLVMQGIGSALGSRGISFPFGGHKKHHHRYEEEPEPESYEYGRQQGVKNKALPLNVFLEMLQQQTGNENITLGNIRPALFDAFGSDASPKIKKFVNLLVQRLQSGESDSIWGSVGALAQDFLKTKLDENENSEQYIKPAMETHVDDPHSAYAGNNRRGGDPGVLISGCQSDQTSADANPSGDASQAYGALSNAIQSVLKSSDQITNRDLVMSVRKLLAQQGFKQEPGLYCSDEQADAPFIV